MLWRNLRACRPAGFLRFILFLPASPASSSNSSASIRVPSLDCRTPKRPVDFQPWRELLSILYSAKNQLARSAPKHSGRRIRQAWLALLRSIFGIRIAITPSDNTAVQCGTSTSAGSSTTQNGRHFARSPSSDASAEISATTKSSARSPCVKTLYRSSQSIQALASATPLAFLSVHYPATPPAAPRDQKSAATFLRSPPRSARHWPR